MSFQDLKNLVEALEFRNSDATIVSTLRDRVTAQLNILNSSISSNIIVKRKTSNQNKNNDTVLVDDTELFFPVVVNESWVFLFYIFYTTLFASGLKITVTAPIGSSGFFGGLIQNSGAALRLVAQEFGTNITLVGEDTNPTGPNICQLISGTILANVNGNIQLRFAQQSANVSNSIMLAGSALIALKTHP